MTRGNLQASHVTWKGIWQAMLPGKVYRQAMLPGKV